MTNQDLIEKYSKRQNSNSDLVAKYSGSTGTNSDLISQFTSKKKTESFWDRTKSSIGGFVGKVGEVLNTGQYAEVAAVEKGLEKVGVLKDSGESLVDKFKAHKSNIDLIRNIGSQTGKGGVLTGQYTPTTSVWGNFWKELPSVAVGTAGDIFLDPLNLVGGAIGKGVKYTGELIGEGAKAVSNNVPALQKIGDMLGYGFVNRFGQRRSFQDIDRSRKIAESEIGENVKKIVSPIIERPSVIQQRIKQVVEGGITTRADIKALAQPLRDELDRVGESISKLNPKLLNPETFARNKGTYFPRMYSHYEFPTEEMEAVQQIFPTKEVSTARARFTQRLSDFEMAKTVKPDLVDTEKKIISLNKKLADMVETRKDTIQAIAKEVDKLEKKGLKLSLKKEEIEPFQLMSSMLEEKSGSYFRKLPNEIDRNPELKPLANEYGIKGSDKYVSVDIKPSRKLIYPKISGREVKKQIERLIFLPENEIEMIHKMIGTRDARMNKILENIKNIRKEYRANLGKLPSLKDISSLARQARIKLGEFREAGYPAAKGLIQLEKAETRQKFYKEVAKIASDEPKPGWVQLSDDKALGDLAGKFLPMAEYRAIAKTRKLPTKLDEVYERGLSLWKTMKTAYNPATISRNDITNMFVLNPLGGVPFWRLDIYGSAIQDLTSKSHIYQLARKQGLEISNQSAAELSKEAKDFYTKNKGLVSRVFSKFQDFHNTVVEFYGSQDKVFKMANFRKGIIEDGLTPYEAMRRANFYLIDYSEVPEAIEWIRKSPIGVPFISFTYGVAKPLAKTLIDHPEKLAAYFKVLHGIQQINPYGETDADRQKETDVLPDWISTGQYLRLPIKDEFGRGQYVNLQYVLPFNIIEQKNLQPSNPIFTITSSILQNKDMFTGNEIYNDKTDTTEEKYSKIFSHIYTQLIPQMAPGGWSWNKIAATVQQRPDAYGYVKDWMQVLGDVIGGIKVTPIDQTLEANKRANEKRKQLQELQSQLKTIMLDKTLFPDEKERQRQGVIEKIRKVNQ